MHRMNEVFGLDTIRPFSSLRVWLIIEVECFLGMNFRITMRVGDFCKFIYTSVSVDPPNKIWSQNFKVSVVRIEPLTPDPETSVLPSH